MIVGKLYTSNNGLYVPLMDSDVDGNRLYLRIVPNATSILNNKLQPFFNQEGGKKTFQRTREMVEAMENKNSFFLSVLNDSSQEIDGLKTTYVPFSELALSVGDSYEYVKEKKRYMVAIFTKRPNYNRTIDNDFALGLNLENAINVIRGAIASKKGIESVEPQYYASGKEMIAFSTILEIIGSEADLAYWTINKPKPNNVIYIKQKREAEKLKKVTLSQVVVKDKFYASNVFVPDYKVEYRQDSIDINIAGRESQQDFVENNFAELPKINSSQPLEFKSYLFKYFGFSEKNANKGIDGIGEIYNKPYLGIIPIKDSTDYGFGFISRTIENFRAKGVSPTSKDVPMLFSEMYSSPFTKRKLSDFVTSISTTSNIQNFFYVTPPLKRVVGDFYSSSIYGEVGVGDELVMNDQPDYIEVVLCTNYIYSPKKGYELVVVTCKKESLQKFWEDFNELTNVNTYSQRLDIRVRKFSDYKNYTIISAREDREYCLSLYQDEQLVSQGSPMLSNLKLIFGDEYRDDFLTTLLSLDWSKINEIKNDNPQAFALVRDFISNLYVDYILENPLGSKPKNEVKAITYGVTVKSTSSVQTKSIYQRLLAQGMSEEKAQQMFFYSNNNDMLKVDSIDEANELYMKCLGYPGTPSAVDNVGSIFDFHILIQKGNDAIFTFPLIGYRYSDNDMAIGVQGLYNKTYSFTRGEDRNANPQQTYRKLDYIRTYYSSIIYLYTSFLMSLNEVQGNEELARSMGINPSDLVMFRNKKAKIGKMIPIKLSAYGYECFNYMNSIGIFPTIDEAYDLLVKLYGIKDPSGTWQEAREYFSFEKEFMKWFFICEGESSMDSDDRFYELYRVIPNSAIPIYFLRNNGENFKKYLSKVGIDFGNQNATRYNPYDSVLKMQYVAPKVSVKPTKTKQAKPKVVEPIVIEEPIVVAPVVEPPIVEPPTPPIIEPPKVTIVEPPTPPIVEPPKPSKKEQLSSKYQELDLDF